MDWLNMNEVMYIRDEVAVIGVYWDEESNMIINSKILG